MLRLLEVMGCVPPVGLFSSKVMVDGELSICFSSLPLSDNGFQTNTNLYLAPPPSYTQSTGPGGAVVCGVPSTQSFCIGEGRAGVSTIARQGQHV